MALKFFSRSYPMLPNADPDVPSHIPTAAVDLMELQKELGPNAYFEYDTLQYHVEGNKLIVFGQYTVKDKTPPIPPDAYIFGSSGR